ENILYHYRLGLSQVEARLVEFKNQEIKFCEKISGLEFKVECRTDRIESLTKELEELKKEKEGLDTKLTGFQTASKDLDNLLESQRTDKNKEGLGYSAIPPSPAQVYSPPKKVMSWTGLFEKPSVAETEASSSTILSKPAIKSVKATERPTINKVETVKKPAVKYAKMYRKTSKRFPTRTTRPNMNAAPRPNVNNARPKTTQDLMIISIQRFKRLERELKARTPPTKIHKDDVRGRSSEDKKNRGTKSKEVVDYILQDKIKLLTKKLKDSEAEHQV
nr:hypothetical protein [Tanacetum cinerariifolium]